MVASETGSGKTGAFCLPLLQVVHEKLQNDAKISATNNTKIVKQVTACSKLDIRLSSNDKDALAEVLQNGFVFSAPGKNW